MSLLRNKLLENIETLNRSIWERRVSGDLVEQWLSNFSGDVELVETEQEYALYLLSRFLYLGDAEVRTLLRGVYRDLVRYPIIQRIRQQENGTLDPSVLETAYTEELNRTRFLGVGNPSESGSHLLYYFRQENHLSKELFISPHLILQPGREARPLRFPEVKRYVFIDDLAGSGAQAKAYSKDVIKDLREAAEVENRAVECWYFPLVARQNAVQYIESNADFDRVIPILELDESYRVFDKTSRVFRQAPSGLEMNTAERIFKYYGERLLPGHALGYRNSQLLLGFHHNTPDNTITAFWYENVDSPWQPIFRRYMKKY